jgi:hypothetical protein
MDFRAGALVLFLLQWDAEDLVNGLESVVTRASVHPGGRPQKVVHVGHLGAAEEALLNVAHGS